MDQIRVNLKRPCLTVNEFYGMRPAGLPPIPKLQGNRTDKQPDHSPQVIREPGHLGIQPVVDKDAEPCDA
jgi:hypothetical protein